MSSPSATYRELEARALRDLAARTIADPDSPPEHVRGATDRLADGEREVDREALAALPLEQRRALARAQRTLLKFRRA